ncbi:MAG: hypothetical protein BWY98_01032 [Tenericutes bacterium ADurb.BinA155]|nr:MAG: hypothetical protein BWY98_01032 [Tenericutes bacterium ADurb.BinA155]
MNNSFSDLSAFTSLPTPVSVSTSMAMAEKRRRKALHLTQKALAEKTLVSLGSLKRFEQQGEISLSSLLRIAFVLDCLSDFAAVFSKPVYRNIDDVLKAKSR